MIDGVDVLDGSDVTVEKQRTLFETIEFLIPDFHNAYISRCCALLTKCGMLAVMNGLRFNVSVLAPWLLPPNETGLPNKSGWG